MAGKCVAEMRRFQEEERRQRRLDEIEDEHERVIELKQKDIELEMMRKWSPAELDSMKHYKEKERQSWERWKTLPTETEFEAQNAQLFNSSNIIHPYLKSRPEYDAYQYDYDDDHLQYGHSE